MSLDEVIEQIDELLESYDYLGFLELKAADIALLREAKELLAQYRGPQD